MLVVIIISSCNPFAPSIDENLNTQSGIISDQTTVQGVFKNFQYAYTFKDTLIYSNLLNNKFLFSYRDYEKGVDVSWGKEEEMRVTNGLFQNSQRLDLIWNNIISMNSDSTQIIRSFNLSIAFNPTDIIFIDGKVNLKLNKTENGKWQIINWIDESNY
ncbi:MAG: hypothetical protein N2321_04725 [Melioribacteraceae bacterium]|nr:hypothetical protein [Melioribacteraceae bacterium]